MNNGDSIIMRFWKKLSESNEDVEYSPIMMLWHINILYNNRYQNIQDLINYYSHYIFYKLVPIIAISHYTRDQMDLNNNYNLIYIRNIENELSNIDKISIVKELEISLPIIFDNINDILLKVINTSSRESDFGEYITSGRASRRL